MKLETGSVRFVKKKDCLELQRGQVTIRNNKKKNTYK